MTLSGLERSRKLDHDERNELELALLAESRRLAELRALRERVKQGHLEADDLVVLRTLVSEAIEQVEPGQECVTLELSEEEEDLGPADRGAVGVEDSTSEKPQR